MFELEVQNNYVLTLKVLNFLKFTSYCSLKPLWSGMGEVVPARYVATSTLKVNQIIGCSFFEGVTRIIQYSLHYLLSLDDIFWQEWIFWECFIQVFYDGQLESNMK